MTRFQTTLCLAGTLLVLAACEQAERTPAATDGTAAAVPGDTLARIAALPPGQLRIVLFRAIRDAGEECQGLTTVQPGPASAGRATWRATCRGAATWMVAIGNDGIAQVTGPVEE